MTIDTASALAEAWYNDRLAKEWRRPEADQIRRIFDFLGMVGPHWQLDA